MEAVLLAFGACVLGVALGAVLGRKTYAHELRRMARFLRDRDPASNARLTVNAPGSGLHEIAEAVNGELDRETEERVRSLRAQQEFQRDLSSLSHDIRTPLTGAKGYLQLAREELDDDARKHELEAAGARIDATVDLLDQLFAFTRASDPDLAIEVAPVAMRPLVESVLLAHFPEFEQRGWEPVVRFADEGFTFEGDAAHLQRVIENLMVNALRHGAGAPVIEQRGQSVTISNRTSDPRAIDVERLFDRFYQADTARGTVGAGLGLATAAKLADAMGLRLSASLEGNVLRFTLEGLRRA